MRAQWIGGTSHAAYTPTCAGGPCPGWNPRRRAVRRDNTKGRDLHALCAHKEWEGRAASTMVHATPSFFSVDASDSNQYRLSYAQPHSTDTTVSDALSSHTSTDRHTIASRSSAESQGSNVYIAGQKRSERDSACNWRLST